MRETTTVKVSKRHQIVVPSSVRSQLNIEAGDRLLADVQDRVLVLIPQPENDTEHLAGLHKEVWAGIESDGYLHRDRDAWSSAHSG